MSEFLTMFNGDSQFIVLSGETGSGKTTQCVPDTLHLPLPPRPVADFSHWIESRNTLPTPICRTCGDPGSKSRARSPVELPP
jgi:hypothetical protein